MRDYNPTHPLGFGTEEPHPLPPPTKSDEIPVVGSSPEAIGMKWVITFQVDNNPERIHFHFAFQQLDERSENVVGSKNFDCSLRVNSTTQQSLQSINLTYEVFLQQKTARPADNDEDKCLIFLMIQRPSPAVNTNKHINVHSHRGSNYGSSQGACAGSSRRRPPRRLSLGLGLCRGTHNRPESRQLSDGHFLSPRGQAGNQLVQVHNEDGLVRL